jgi:hypothetical protein
MLVAASVFAWGAPDAAENAGKASEQRIAKNAIQLLFDGTFRLFPVMRASPLLV